MDGREQPAGLGWRLGARIVDVVVFAWLVAFVVVEIDQRLLGGDPWGVRRGRLELDTTRPIVLALGLALAYEVVPLVLYGATAGKAMFGLRVRVTGRSVPTVLVAFVRTGLLYLPALLLGPAGAIVVLVMLASVVLAANGRGLHDRVAGTVVVGLPDRGDG